MTLITLLKAMIYPPRPIWGRSGAEWPRMMKTFAQRSRAALTPPRWAALSGCWPRRPHSAWPSSWPADRIAGEPVIAVGSAAIDLTPMPVKDFAIQHFGSHDKTVLLTGI